MNQLQRAVVFIVYNEMYVYAQLEKKEKVTNIRRALKENREKRRNQPSTPLHLRSSSVGATMLSLAGRWGPLGQLQAATGAPGPQNTITVGITAAKTRTSNVVIIKVRIEPLKTSNYVC